MTLELSGVRLVAENASQFLATMRQGDAALASFAQASGRAASDTAAFARATQQIKLDGLNNQLRDQQTRLGILKQQLGETAQKYGEASTQAQAKAAAVAKLSAAVGITEQKIGLLAQQMAAEADAAGAGARASDQLTRGLKDVEQGAGRAESALQQVATGALRKIGSLGVEAFGQLTQAAASFVGEGIQGLADYQSEIAMLGAVSGASGAELAAASAAAKALGSDLTLPTTSAGTAAEAMTELTKAGLSVQEAIDAAKGTLQVATIEELNNAEAAEIVAGALNMFGLQGKQASLVADELAATAGASAVSVRDLAIATANGGSVWAAFQGPTVGATQSLTDFNTALGLLGNAGIKGSSAGTALKNAMLFLAAPTDKANDLMHDLVGNIGMTGTIAFDASGKMRSFPEILDITARATAGLSEQQRDAALKTIFGGDAVSAIIPLLKAGGDGWAEMAAKVERAGAANDLAGAKMTGIHGAVKGLQSGLETLALNGLEPLAPLIEGALGALGALVSDAANRAGPVMTDVAETLVAVGQGAAAVASAIQAGIVPAFGVATAAALAYAAVNSGQIGIALVLVVQRLALATAGLLANAAAAALAVAPYALIAAALAGVVVAYSKFNDAVKGSVQQALDSRKWWQDSAQALTDYGAASSETQTRLSAHAATIRELRSEIQGELEDLTRRATAGMVNEAQYTSEMAAINAKRAGLIQVTGAMETEIAAQLRQQAASMTATAATAEQANATQGLGSVVNLTAEQIGHLADELTDVMQKGSAALGAFATSAAGYIATTEQNQATHNQRMQELSQQLAGARTEAERKGIEERLAAEQTGYQQQQQNAAEAYAIQAAQQRQALGEQLLAYIENQRQLGNITDEKAAEISETTIQHFGVMRDSSAALFGDMARSVDQFASGATGSASDVAAAWGTTEDAAVTLKQKADALIKQYTMELVAEMDKPGANIDAIRKKLADIPARVYSEIIITETHRTSGNSGDRAAGGGVDDSGNTEGRASGGPVRKGRTYLVGETGPELVTFADNGHVYPHDQTQQILASGLAGGGDIGAGLAAAMLGMPALFGGGGPGYSVPATAPAAGPVNSSYQDNRQYTMPVYTNNSPGVLQQGYYTMKAQIL